MENSSEKKNGFIEKIKQLSGERFNTLRRVIYLLFAALPLVSLFALMFAPFSAAIYYQNYNEPVKHYITPMGAFDALNSDNRVIASFAVIQLVILAVIVTVMLIVAFNLLRGLFSFNDEKLLAKRVKGNLIFSTSLVGLYTVFSFCFSPINRAFGGITDVVVDLFAPIFIIAISILYAAFAGLVGFAVVRVEDDGVFEKRMLEQRKRTRRKLLRMRVELFSYALICAVVGVLAILSNIITVVFTSAYATIGDISLSGWDLLTNPIKYTQEGEQLLTYAVFVLLVLISTAAFLSLVSFFSRSQMFYKIAVITVGASTSTALLVGLFGKYYEIVQHLNDAIIMELIGDFIASAGSLYDYTVKSSAFYYFLIALGVVALLFFRHPYTKALQLERQIAEEDASRLSQVVEISNIEDAAGAGGANGGGGVSFAGEPEWHDPCPAFTAIDARVEEFSAELERRREALFDDPTLPRLVDFIVQYARDSRLHLFYTQESVATFLAGLGTTRLTILQGMSGTGKTSLPKIVAEALMSVCDIVEVESSWRDKNELLGYYNEFSKTYTPKKFTQALYEARLNPETITFIVLDEMNLSRIEYYFSDFLSLMENEEDKRELKLLNVPLVRRMGKVREEYLGLVHGFTLKIPSNVWFIGTANRDESTYDISDKVYDRAHTMNFDKRAVRLQYYNEPKAARYLTAQSLMNMFSEARERVDFTIEKYPVIAEVEALLSPYNISFGNRIALQIENFVKIYASCFTVNDLVIKDALETILLSKVVRKLELKSIDDKETLAEEFAKLGLARCSEFITNLKED